MFENISKTFRKHFYKALDTCFVFVVSVTGFFLLSLFVVAGPDVLVVIARVPRVLHKSATVDSVQVDVLAKVAQKTSMADSMFLKLPSPLVEIDFDREARGRCHKCNNMTCGCGGCRHGSYDTCAFVRHAVQS